MGILIAGLVIFLGLHSVRIVAEPWRAQWLSQKGEKSWKGLYSLVSVVGFGLICWGYSVARLQPVVLWMPPVGMRHATATLMLLSWILLVAAYVPGNSIKARLHHPMLLGVKTWAFAHLLINGTLVSVLLFGSFLAWAVACFISARRRDRAEGRVYPAGRLGATVLTVVLGVVAYAAFAFYLHRLFIGVPVFA